MSKDEGREGCGSKDSNQKRQRKNAAAEDFSKLNGRLEASTNGISIKENRNGSPIEAQDADYSYMPSLNEEISLLILARVLRSEYQKLCSVNRRYNTLVQSGELYTIRKGMEVSEPSIFMLASGEPNWCSCDLRSCSHQNLPILPSDSCFSSFDKESICAGTHTSSFQGRSSGALLYGGMNWRWLGGSRAL